VRGFDPGPGGTTFLFVPAIVLSTCRQFKVLPTGAIDPMLPVPALKHWANWRSRLRRCERSRAWKNKVSKFQGCKGSKVSTEARFQGCKVARFQRGKVSKFQGFKVSKVSTEARFQGCKVARFQRGKVSDVSERFSRAGAEPCRRPTRKMRRQPLVRQAFKVS
jgi:hypothetical protein